MEKDISFIVLCKNLKDLKSTIYWLSIFKKEIILISSYEDRNILKEYKNKYKNYQIKEANETSMINKGMNKTSNYWNFILKSGAILKNINFNKINNMRNDDCVYHGINLKNRSFYENSINWIFMNKNIFSKNGEFDTNYIDCNSKLEWSYKLYENNFILKGVAGVNLY